VREIVRLFRSFYRQGRDVDELLALVELESKRDTWYVKLSGGQKQRLAVACALVGRPDLLFLDEPTTGLDPQSRRQFWDLLARFRAEGGTIVITTHYMEEAETLCDRVSVVDRGRVIAQGTPRELIQSLGAEHVIEFTVAGGAPVPADGLGALPGVRGVRQEDGTCRLSASEVHVAVPALLAALEARGATLASLVTHTATLEDVFVSLTGRHLRDE
jgi:ABC-2 type transport system ATP-binding protein